MNTPQLDNMDSQERRYRHRLAPVDAVPVVDDFRHTQLGVIGNLSVSGMMLICEDALPEGMTCQIRFRLAEHTERDFVIGVEVLWTQANGDGDSYWSGLRIIDINPEDHRLLLELLDNDLTASAETLS
jgi:non-ribosomal peptide synthetase component E (peptide arylation enzyme)